jgi:hypothetical protein
MPEQPSMGPNGPTPTCKSSVFAGQRGFRYRIDPTSTPQTSILVHSVNHHRRYLYPHLLPALRFSDQFFLMNPSLSDQMR